MSMRSEWRRYSMAAWIAVGVLIGGGCAKPSALSKEGRTLPSPRQFMENDAAEDERFIAAPPGSRNVTAEFRERFPKAAEMMTAERLAAIKPCRVILVHGLLGEVGTNVQKFLDHFDSREQRLVGFYKDQDEAFDRMGIKHERVVYRSHAVERCAGKIIEAIEKSDEPVVVFSHSKGCIDTLEALLRLQRDGKLGRVRGWVAAQGVFFGAPNADKYVESTRRRIFGIAAMRCLGANFDAIRDCSQKARNDYMEQHADEIASLVKAVPVLCFASWARAAAKDGEGKDAGKPGELCSAFKIQPQSSILPGADFVAKSGISHNQTVIADGEPFDRVAFTQTLISMLADRMKTAPAPAR